MRRKQSSLIEANEDDLTDHQVREAKEREDMEANDEFAIQMQNFTITLANI